MEWVNLIANNAILQALAQTLMHFTWQGTVIAVTLYVLLKNIDIRQSNFRYSISLVALLLCVVTPVTTFLWLHEPATPSQAIDVNQVLSGVTATVVHAGGSLNESGFLGLSLLTTELLDYVNSANVLALMPFFAVAWLVSVALLSSRVILQMIGVYQLPYQSTHAPDLQLQQIFERLLLQLEVTSRTRLYISEKVDVPMAIGWLKPVVLLPSSMVLGLTPGQLEMLLVHELAHIKRHDYVVNFLQTLVELMLFFHPGVKWISKQIRLERECCCDNTAVAHIGSPVAYACTLTDAEMSRASNVPELAMAASGSDLKQRILRVVGQSDCTSGHSRIRYTAILAAIISLLSVMVIVSTNKAEEPAPMVFQDESKQSDIHAATESVKENKQAIPQKYVETVSQQVPEITTIIAQEKTILPSDSGAESEELVVAEVVETVSVADTPSDLLTKEQIQVTRNTTEADVLSVPAETKETDSVTDTQENLIAQEQSTTERETTAPIASVKSKDSSSAAAEGAIAAQVNQSLVSHVSSEPIIEDVQKQANSEHAQTPEESAIVSAPAVLLNGEAPAYPRQALRRKLSDDVAVTFVVNTKGKVEDISFIGEVHRSFKRSIERALENWQFEPAQQNGNAVTSSITRVFSFIEPDHITLPTTGTRIYRR